MQSAIVDFCTRSEVFFLSAVHLQMTFNLRLYKVRNKKDSNYEGNFLCENHVVTFIAQHLSKD